MFMGGKEGGRDQAFVKGLQGSTSWKDKHSDLGLAFMMFAHSPHLSDHTMLSVFLYILRAH